MTIEEVKQIIFQPISVPNWPSYGQSIERRVKQVTEAAHTATRSRIGPKKLSMKIFDGFNKYGLS